jgi:hypothetical protein
MGLGKIYLKRKINKFTIANFSLSMIEAFLYSLAGTAILGVIVYLTAISSLQYSRILSIFLIVSMIITIIFELAYNHNCGCLSLGYLVPYFNQISSYINKVFAAELNISYLIKAIALVPIIYFFIRSNIVGKIYEFIIVFFRYLLFAKLASIVIKIYISCVACTLICSHSIDNKLVVDCISDTIKEELVSIYEFVVYLFSLAIS